MAVRILRRQRSMYRLETRGDFIVYFFLSGLFVAAGALALAHPSRRVAEDPADYVAVSGVLKSVQGVGARRSRNIEFTLQFNDITYGSRHTPYGGVAEHWTPGRTALQFLVEKHNPQERQAGAVVQVYALSVDGAAARDLAADIAETNSFAGARFGLVLVTIGLVHVGIGALAWRRTRAS